MRSLYALHLSLSVVILAIQPRLRLSGTNRLLSAFHGGQRMFEALVIDWLKEASISAVSQLMGLSWNAIDGIMQRAIKRGLARREEINPTRIGVDKTAFRKRHDYVTVVSDQDIGTVLHLGKDRKKATLKEWYNSLTEEQRGAIESVSMDMELLSNLVFMHLNPLGFYSTQLAANIGE
ncbi:MAG: transposase [Candidatus Thiodiazotropha sp. (ex Lucinoma aequizonata)]|nr:transposase [Candidatus Thiodiazotropha sp. (ex Lucinoma aequizonata)]